jgi:hypothetical protein
VLLKRAATLEQAGEVESALTALREAAALAEAAGDPRLRWVLRFNLATNLCHLGRYREAENLLPEIRALAAALGHELDRLRVLWLSGRMPPGGAGRRRRRAALEEARRELAALELEAGRTGEVRALAEDMVWILRSHGLSREAMAALGLFCRAAAAERATPALAPQVLADLERAPHNPQARFEAGG